MLLTRVVGNGWLREVDEPLEFRAVVYPEPAAGTDEDEEGVEAQLKVAEGQEVKDLRYTATLVAQD